MVERDHVTWILASSDSSGLFKLLSSVLTWDPFKVLRMVIIGVAILSKQLTSLL